MTHQLDLFKLVVGSSLVTQTVKCLPTMWETWVRSLGQEDPLEKEMATHSSTLAWKVPWMEEPGVAKSWMRLSDFTFTFKLVVFSKIKMPNHFKVSVFPLLLKNVNIAQVWLYSHMHVC